MSNKLKILDDIIDIEDELELSMSSRIKNEVIEKIRSIHGDDGVAVCNQYYASDSKPEDIEDCPECAEKAKKLIELMRFSQSITSSLSNSDVNDTYDYLKTNSDFSVLVKNLVETVSGIIPDQVKVSKDLVEFCIIKELIKDS